MRMALVVASKPSEHAGRAQVGDIIRTSFANPDAADAISRRNFDNDLDGLRSPIAANVGKFKLACDTGAIEVKQTGACTPTSPPTAARC